MGVESNIQTFGIDMISFVRQFCLQSEDRFLFGFINTFYDKISLQKFEKISFFYLKLQHLYLLITKYSYSLYTFYSYRKHKFVVVIQRKFPSNGKLFIDIY